MIHALGPRTRGIFELLRERIVSGELERARLEGLLTAATEQLARQGRSPSVEDF
jgi:hypothetical protein